MKIVVFTFDDGLINTTYQILNIIPSTFYIVTGWSLRSNVIYDKSNLNLNHGTLNEWVNLHKKGVDLGFHGHNHLKVNNSNFLNDVNTSYTLFSEYFSPPYHFSFPYSNYIAMNFDSLKTGSDLGLYNQINSKSLMRVNSYNPFLNNDGSQLKDIIKQTPDNHFLVLTFHGIEEGWCPCTLDYLIDHYNFCIQNEIMVMTMSQLFKMIKSNFLN